MRSRSDSEPTRMPITASATDRDVSPELHAGEIYVRHAFVRGVARLGDRAARPNDVEDAAAVRDHVAVLERRPGVEDERPALLSGRDSLDRRAGFAPLGIV